MKSFLFSFFFCIWYIHTNLSFCLPLLTYLPDLTLLACPLLLASLLNTLRCWTLLVPGIDGNYPQIPQIGSKAGNRSNFGTETRKNRKYSTSFLGTIIVILSAAPLSGTCPDRKYQIKSRVLIVLEVAFILYHPATQHKSSHCHVRDKDHQHLTCTKPQASTRDGRPPTTPYITITNTNTTPQHGIYVPNYGPSQ